MYQNKMIKEELQSFLMSQEVTLVVTDKYGQISEISKDVVVQSVLRPQLKATPRAAVWESYITFEASSNKNILSYERDF